jgi:predicted dehydrogenase
MHEDDTMTRREFTKGAGAMAAITFAGAAPLWAHAANAQRLKVAVIGCGGRGAGAAVNALEASPDVEVTALADVFEDRLRSSRAYLESLAGEFDGRVNIDDSRCFVGFDAYRQLIAGDVDLVILATPPHFRPMHLAEAVAHGKHVFMEKPVAVDPAGIRSVLASAEVAKQKRLAIVAGTQRRHETSYLETMLRVADGAIGRIISASCYWNQGGLWMNPRKAEWSDMEWQLRNWLYFTWLSGDHIVEQHVHNLDVINWAMGSPPVRALGMGGRQVRIDPAYGHVFDHFAVEYEYPNGVMVTSMCRQIDGCSSRVEEVLHGSEGVAKLSPGRGVIEGADAWHFGGENNNPYVQEHVDLIASIQSGSPLNEAKQVAESTLTAIMGRMSAYTGKKVSWDQALNSQLDLTPARYALGDLPTPEVAAPGRTPLI